MCKSEKENEVSIECGLCLGFWYYAYLGFEFRKRIRLIKERNGKSTALPKPGKSMLRFVLVTCSYRNEKANKFSEKNNLQ
eukprot:snap_masked-scaffold_79-processed-gene-0.35-mRNA-1 protein AED:1.00 eAED:1.00 QI:0/0/0/0/1/1/2/0/79